VDDGDPKSVADAILRLANDTAERERVAANALRAAPNYSRERHAQETLDLLIAMQGATR
jgi:glycosyltransferase involved in cell wall biosynthesis